MPLPQISAGTVPRQTPATQLSFVVHELPSLHDPELGVCVQPPAPSHASAVQGLLSSHEYGVPLHTPSTQTSPLVHASPSSQGRPALQDDRDESAASFAVKPAWTSFSPAPVPHATTAIRAYADRRRAMG